MSIDIDILLDLDQAEKEAQEFEKSIAATMGRAANKGAAEFEGFAKRAVRTLENLKQQQMQRINEMRGGLGDLRDVFDLVGKSVLGLSEASAKAASEAFYLTEKGLALGAAFGPLGALLGTVAGGMLGVVHQMISMRKEAAKMPKVTKDVSDRVMDLMLSSFDLTDSITGKSKDAAEGFNELKDSIDATLSPDDLTKKSGKTLKQELADIDKELKNRKDSIGDTIKEIERLKKKPGELVIKYTDNRAEAEDKVGKLATAEADLIKKEKELAEAQKLTSEQTDRRSKLTAELSSRSKEAAQAVSALSIELDNILSRSKGDDIETMFDSAGMREMREEATQLSDVLLDVASMKLDEDGSILDTEGMRDAVDVVGEMTDATAKLNDEFGLLGADMKEVIVGFGQDMANTFAGAAVKSVDAFFESIATGQSRTLKDRQAARAAFLRELGTQLIADGTKNELIGVGRGLMGDPSGWGLAAWGLGEQVTGFGMGGIGARAQRRGGYGDEESSPAATGSRGPSSGGGGLGSGNQSPATPGTVIYQIYAGGAPGSTTIIAGDGPASTAKAHRELSKIQSQGQRLGGGGFSRKTP